MSSCRQNFPSVSAPSVLCSLLSVWPGSAHGSRQTRDHLSVCQSWHKISRQILLKSSGMVSGSCVYLRQSASCPGLGSAVKLSYCPSGSPDYLSVFLQPVPLCPAPVRLSSLSACPLLPESSERRFQPVQMKNCPSDIAIHALRAKLTLPDSASPDLPVCFAWFPALSAPVIWYCAGDKSLKGQSVHESGKWSK